MNRFAENESKNSRTKLHIIKRQLNVEYHWCLYPWITAAPRYNEYKQVWRIIDKEVKEKSDALAVNLKMCTLK